MYNFVTVPDRPPHCCISCKIGVRREWFLDLGESADDPAQIMPTIYVCNECLTAACSDKGLVDQGPLLKRIEELGDSLFDARTKAEGLDQGLTGLLRARFVDPADPLARQLVGLLEVDPTPPGGFDPPGESVEGGQQPSGSDPVGADGEPAQPGAEPNLGAVRPGFRLDVDLG